MDLVEVLSFLFMLSTMELGRVLYSFPSLIAFNFGVRSIRQTTLAPAKRRCSRTFAITALFGRRGFVHIVHALHPYPYGSSNQPTSRRFSPTRLATTLTSSSPPLPTSTGTNSGPQEGFIILETNYRVYAYTGSPVHHLPLSDSKFHQTTPCRLLFSISSSR